MIRGLALSKCLTGAFEKGERKHFRGFTTERTPAITFCRSGCRLASVCLFSNFVRPYSRSYPYSYFLFHGLFDSHLQPCCSSSRGLGGYLPFSAYRYNEATPLTSLS
jgi:hypothetical protein